MQLKSKREITPPPTLSMYPQMVITEIQKWKNVIANTHWHFHDNKKVDGAEFYLDKYELGHIHLDGSMHYSTTSELKSLLLNCHLAKKFPFGKNWIAFQISNINDVKQALFLFELNYEMLNGTLHTDLMLKIDHFMTDENNKIMISKIVQTKMEF